ncbi:MAG: sugar transferase [Patescibacteria group bacterium]
MANIIIKSKKLLLLLGDIIIFYLALYLTLLWRYGYPVNSASWQSHAGVFVAVFVLWLIVFFINDFYDLKISYNSVKLVNNLLKLFIINGVVAVVLFYFFIPLLGSDIKPQRVLLIDLIFSFVLIFIWRKFFYHFIKSDKIANNVLIIGQSPIIADELFKEINNRPQLGYKAMQLLHLSDNLKEFCLKNKINILLSAENLKNNPELTKNIFSCLSLGIDVYNINSFYENITGKVPVEYIDHGWFLENLTENSKNATDAAIRIFDIIFSLIGLLISLPFWPLIMLGVRTSSNGPIFLRQKRVGKNGETFPFKKFRSMITNAPDGSAEGESGPIWAATNDKRVTKFGKILRKTRIDELPQLINILKGEMSFVGPRPERPEFVEMLAKEIPFYQERLLVKPGLTGWAQLYGPAYGGSKAESLEKIKYDLYYVKNRSLFLNFSIVLKTLRVVLGGRGQ